MAKDLNEVKVTEEVVTDSEVVEDVSSSDSEGFKLTLKDVAGITVIGLAAKGLVDIVSPGVKKLADKTGVSEWWNKKSEERKAKKEERKAAREAKKAAKKAAKAESKEEPKTTE